MRSNKRKNSGFTLVELVVAIAVLGVITAIVLPTVNNIQKNNLTRKYTTYENSILSSVKLYIDAYEEDEFDKNSLTPQCKAITYDDLKNHNLLKEYNVNGVSCKGKSVGDDNGIAAYVYKTNGKYEYYPMISCKKASSTESEYDSSQVVPNVCTNSSYSAYISGSTCFYKEPTVTLDLNHEGDSFKNIESMGYAVIDLNYKDDIEYIKNSTSYTNVELRNNSIDIELPEPENGESREYRLVLKYVYKNDDVKYEVKNNKLVVDYRKPTITISALKYKTNQAEGTKYNSGEWTNENVKVTVNVENGCGKQKGFEREYSTDTIADDKFSISYGKKGYESTVEKKIAVRIDKTPPTCTINLDGTKGNNNWYVSDVSLKLSKEDEKNNNVSSGIAEFGLARSSKPNYNKKELAEQEDDTTGEKWYGYVKDKAGNTAKCSKTIKKDTVAPTCKINKKGTLGNDNWYTSNVNLSLEKSDSGSGVDSYNLTTSSSVSYGSTSTATQTSDTSSQKWYGYVKDKAGNTKECSTTLKKDSTPPSVPIITLKKWSDNSTTPSNSTYGSLINYSDGTWSNMNIYTRASSSDSVSGISEYYYTTTGATENNKNASGLTRNIKASGTSYIKYRACDNAGNCSNYTKDYAVKIDKVAPTCSIDLSGTKGNNDWYISNVNLNLTKSDGESGVDSYNLTTSSSVSYGSTSTATQTADTSSQTWYGYVKDKAGNTTKCSKNIKKDTIPPSVPVITLKKWSDNSTTPSNSTYSSLTNYTAGTWSNRNIYTRASSSDGVSGVGEYYYTTTGATANATNTSSITRNIEANGTSYIKYKACDVAGNCSNYSDSYTVMVDKVAPTCSIDLSGTKGNNDWYISNVNLNLTKSDGESGVDSYNLTTSSSISYGSTSTATQTADTSSQTWYGYVKDQAGNTAKCTKNLKKDTTPPNVPTITLKKWSNNSDEPNDSTYSSLTNYSNEAWSNKNIYTRASSSDALSGVGEYYYTTTGATANATNTSSITRNIKANGTSYIKYKACDKAGNCSNYTSDYTVKIDKVAPTCTSSGESTSWTNQNVTLTGKCSDSGSGCKSSTVSTTISTEMNSTVSPGTVYDNAGNGKNCPNQTVKIDKTAPTCTSSGGSTSWTNKNVTLTGTCSDTGGSGCKSSTVSKTVSNEMDSTVSPGKVYDNAGNSATCSNQKVRIDKTAPAVPTIVFKKWSDNDTEPTKSNYSSLSNYATGNWSNRKIYTIPTSSSDSGSAVTYYVTTSGATTDYTDKSATYKNIAANGTSYIKYKACDAAGNCSSYTSNYTVKIDKTAPTCTSSGGSTSWTNKNVTLTGTCSDTGGSGCKSSTVSKTVSKEMDSTVSPGKVYDNAGNSKSCPKETVKIDKTAPTLTITPSAGSYNKTTLVQLKCADTDGSGVKKSSISFNSDTYSESASKVSFRFTTAVTNKKATFKCTDNAGNSDSDSRTYTVKNACPDGETVFGKAKGDIEGNYGKKVTANKQYWSSTWCHNNGKKCWADYGYERICIASWCKGKTSIELKKTYGCDYADYWCTCN